jgi:hypothetical protein
VGLLLPAGVPGLLGVHVCPNHGHAPAETSAASTTPTHDHGAMPSGGHGHHAPAPADAAPHDSGLGTSSETSCDGLCELLCLGGALLADPRVFVPVTVIEIGAPMVVAALHTDRAAHPRGARVPFVLPPSHAPPLA